MRLLTEFGFEKGIEITSLRFSFGPRDLTSVRLPAIHNGSEGRRFALEWP